MAKKSKRKFYRTVIKVEILSEEKYPDGSSLEGIAYDIGDGDCVGRISTTVDNQPVPPDKMVKLLNEFGSEPGFFQLNPDGSDEKNPFTGQGYDENEE